VRITAATPSDILDVARNMRDSDLREFSALLPVDGRGPVAQEVLRRHAAHDDTMCASLAGNPVAIGTARVLRPNVATLLFFATGQFRQIALPLTRFIRQRLFVELRMAGVHRIECISIDGHEQAHRWIKILGLRHEAVCKGYGKNGETFHQFAWVSPDAGKTGRRN
jgi:hypothetical protein